MLAAGSGWPLLTVAAVGLDQVMGYVAVLVSRSSTTQSASVHESVLASQPVHGFQGQHDAINLKRQRFRACERGKPLLVHSLHGHGMA